MSLTVISVATAPSLPATHQGVPSEGIRFLDIEITESRHFPPAPAAECWVYVTLNAEIALARQEDAALHALLHSRRARVSVDGQWVLWALQRKYAKRAPAKMSGSDLIHDLAEHCSTHGERLLLLGSSFAANTQAVDVLRGRWPGLQVQGFAPGQFEPGDDREASVVTASLDAIRQHQPHYVILGMGPTKQYRLALQLATQLDRQVAGLLCFGGAIDMVGGQVRRAPRTMQHWGLEGLYRLWQQPSRLPRLLRVLRILPIVAFKRF